jgi:hypothetical protein
VQFSLNHHHQLLHCYYYYYYLKIDSCKSPHHDIAIVSEALDFVSPSDQEQMGLSLVVEGDYVWCVVEGAWVRLRHPFSALFLLLVIS